MLAHPALLAKLLQRVYVLISLLLLIPILLMPEQSFLRHPVQIKCRCSCCLAKEEVKLMRREPLRASNTILSQGPLGRERKVFRCVANSLKLYNHQIRKCSPVLCNLQNFLRNQIRKLQWMDIFLYNLRLSECT